MRKLLYIAAISLLPTLAPAASSDALEEHLQRLRAMTTAERNAVNESDNYQIKSREQKRLNDEIFRPLLEGELAGFIPSLRRALVDPDPYIRTYAAQLITVAASNPEVSMSQVAATPRREATTVLLRDLLTKVQDSDEDVRHAVAHALGRTGHLLPEDTLRAYDVLLVDRSARVRREALFGVAWIPGAQKRALAEAMRVMRLDADTNNRIAAASMLAEPVYRESTLSQDLVKAFNKEQDSDVQTALIRTLVARAEFDETASNALEVIEDTSNVNEQIKAEIERIKKKKAGLK